MNAAVIAVLGSGTGAVGAIVVAALSSWLNRKKDDAAIAKQVSEAWTPLVAELRGEVAETRRECGECRSELANVKKVLRAWVRASDSGNSNAIDEAVAAARDIV